MMVLAVHLADGAVMAPWLLAGWVGAALLVFLASRQLHESEIPRIGVLTAAFFIASLIHVPAGMVKVHPLLAGLLGMVLGLRAPLAVAVGLVLQALCLGHGGLTTLGVNTCIMSLPALGVAMLYAAARRLGGLHTLQGRWTLGATLSGLGVLAALVLYYAVIRFGSAEEQDLQFLAAFAFFGHLPILILEALMGATLLDFLYRVKPELILPTGETPRPPALPTGQYPP